MRSSVTTEARSAIGRIAAIAARAQAEEARQRSRAPDPESYDEIFRRTVEGADEIQKRIVRERKHGQAQWLVLERHPQPRRLVMIRNDRRLHTWGLYEVLLAKARGAIALHPRAAVPLAELALAVARCLDPEVHGEERTADLQAAALAALADARRRLADRRGAWQAFDSALEHLEEGTGDPLERAELEILRARLLRDFGPEEGVERSLRRAEGLLRRIGDKRPQKDLLEDAAQDVVHRRATR